MLQSTDGKYFDPVLVPYLKALHVVLGHQANVEHMKRPAWLDAVDFCVEGIDSFVLDSQREPESIPRSSSGTAGRSLPSRTLVRSASTSSNGANDSNTISLAKSHAEELLEILQSLLTPTSVPVSEVYETTTKCVLNFWQALWDSQGSRVEKSFVSIFKVLNRTISFTRTDKTVFTMAIAQDIVPIISQFWRSKSVAKDEGLNAVRDEMLIFLFAVHPHLEKCIRNGDHVLKRLEELAEVLKTDYGKRAAKDQLQIDDLEMEDFGSQPALAPFRLESFWLRAHNIRGERNWAHLQVIGILEGLISIGKQNEPNPQRNDEDLEKHIRKRQKVAYTSNRILDSLKHEEEKPRVAGLQTIPFILTNQQLKASELEELLHRLAALAADKRGDVAVWALIAMSRFVMALVTISSLLTYVLPSCTFQKSSTVVDSSLWLSLWRIGTRALVLSNTCRAASLQLHSILAANLLVYRDVSEDVSAIITSADVSGPVLLCDSSLFLMMHLLQTRIREVPGASLATSKHTIRWLFARWDPGMYNVRLCNIKCTKLASR
jgi:ataxia telangiectasia mutated family protein